MKLYSVSIFFLRQYFTTELILETCTFHSVRTLFLSLLRVTWSRKCAKYLHPFESRQKTCELVLTRDYKCLTADANISRLRLV